MQTLETLVRGKDAVLDYLEQDAQRRTGKAGVYQIVGNDLGERIVVIAGHAFSCQFHLSAASMVDTGTMRYENGIMVEIEEKVPTP